MSDPAQPPAGTGALGTVTGAPPKAVAAAQQHTTLLSAAVPGGMGVSLGEGLPSAGRAEAGGGVAGGATPGPTAASWPLPPGALTPQTSVGGAPPSQPPSGGGAGPAEKPPADEHAAAIERAAVRYERRLQQRCAAEPGGDKMVAFLSTLVTYPLVYLMLARAARTGTSGATATADEEGSTSAAGVLDGRRRLEDFPEGRAIADLEKWCRTNAYMTVAEELMHRYAQMVAAVIDANVTHATGRAVLLNSWLLSLAGVQPPQSLGALVTDHLPRSMELLGRRDPASALAELQPRIRANLAYVKRQLERRYALVRGPTLLERAEVFLSTGRRAARLFFTMLRLWARAAHYISSLLSIVSGALSFTVVPAIVLSLLSAGAQIFALTLTSVADFAEPVLLSALEWGQAGTSQVGAVTDHALALGPRRLPAHTVEALAPLLEGQIEALTTIVNRPEIPRLSSDPLLVKAYDLGLVDAMGDVESRAVWRLLERGGYGVFRSSGFFGYASPARRRAAHVLLARALAWQRVNAVVRGGEALRFVIIAGTPHSGKSALFARLTQWQQGRAGGGGGGIGGAVGAGGGGKRGAVPAVDMRPLADPTLRGAQVVVFPGLRSEDPGTATLAQGLLTLLSGMAACMVFMASPDADPSDPEALSSLALALAAHRGALLCVNRGPAGANNTPAAARGGGSWGSREQSPETGRSSSPEELAARWRAAVEALCFREGLDASLCSVVVTDIWTENGGGVGGPAQQQVDAGVGGKALPEVGVRGGAVGPAAGGAGGAEGPRGFRDVEDWVRREAAAYHRSV